MLINYIVLCMKFCGVWLKQKDRGSTPHSNLVSADQYPKCVSVRPSQTLDSMVCTQL